MKNMKNIYLVVILAFIGFLIISPIGSAAYASAVVDSGGGFSQSMTNVLGAPNGNYVSIEPGEWITLSFGGSIINGPGNDIIVTEYLAANEKAKILVSNDGSSFTELGTALSGGTSSFDLNNIGWSSAEYVKVLGIPDGAGTSPGFDLDAVEVKYQPPTPPIPEVPTMMMVSIGIVGLLYIGKRRR